MFIRDSRRSYRTYSYVELILITDLCAFRTPVGVTELMLMLRSLNLFGGTRRYHRDYGTYTGNSEHILVLRNLYWSYGTYTGLTKLILVYRTYSYLTDLILVLQNLLLYFGYRSTRRYYRTFYWYKSTRRYYRTDSLYGGTRRYHWTYTYLTDTGVLVGTTELVLIY